MPTLRHSAIVFALLAVVGAAQAQPESAGPVIGQPAPPLTLEEILQAPDGAKATWADLKGKVVVLEYWATWCVPCVAAFPHINELADHFKDQPVQFIAITDEKSKLVIPFLKKKPLHTWVGLDTDRSTHDAYQVIPIPRTFVVDTNGILVHDTHPTKLTQEMIADLLAGKSPVAGPAAAKTNPPLFEIAIRPASGRLADEFKTEPGKLTGTGVALQSALAHAFGVPARRIVTLSPLPEKAYDISVTLPAGHEGELAARLQDALEAAFAIHVRRDTREADGYVLSLIEGEELLVSDGTYTENVEISAAKSGQGHLQATHVTLETFAATLADILDREVFCETKADDRYNFDVRWNSDRPESLLDVLPQDTGMKLEPAKRAVEMLIVEIKPA